MERERPPEKARPDDARAEPPSAGRLGRYELRRLLGSGGMGIVYEAWDDQLARRVALKVLGGAAARSPQALQRFAHEATLAARLDHPSIVRIYEAGQIDGQAFIAMELVDGGTLEEQIEERLGPGAGLEGAPREVERAAAVKRLAPDDVRRLVGQLRDVALALHHGHTYTPPGTRTPAPIIHRDVKPANVMIDAHGRARLLDFGLAKELGVQLTVTREALGTPLYMSPEQLHSARRVGPRSDVYSLGMTLYACLTLARPFEQSRPERLFQLLLHDDPPAPRRLNAGVPAELEAIVLRATEKDERRRYASAAALAEDLQAFLDGRPVVARPLGRVGRGARWLRRRPRAVLAAFLVLVALALWSWRASELEADAALAAELARGEAEQRARHSEVEAAELLGDAELLYELGKLAREEEPHGERWLGLTSEGYAKEGAASEALVRGGGSATAPEVQRRTLRARAARGDPRAVEEMRVTLAKAREAGERAGRAEALLAELEPLGTTPEAYAVLDAACEATGWASLVSPGALPSDRARGHALALRDLLGNGVLADRVVSIRIGRHDDVITSSDSREPPHVLRLVLRELASRALTWRRTAEAEPALAAALAEVDPLLLVRVAPAPGVTLPEGARLALLSRDGATLAEGPAGEPLLSRAGGEVVLVVRAGDAEVLLPVSAPVPVLGTPRREVDVELPAAPADAPAGMLLVSGRGRPFWLDRAEVTFADYARFVAHVAAHGHAACPAEERRRFPAGKDHGPRASGVAARGDLPVVGVDAWDALAYAAWKGKRLPTRAEWEAAAWGPFAPAPARDANLGRLDDGWAFLAPAGSGVAAPCGARDLVGNAAEWLEPDLDLPVGEAAGGSFARDAAGVERFALEAVGADLGFRCARDLPASAAPGASPPERLGRDGSRMVLVPGGELRLLDRTAVDTLRRRADAVPLMVELRPFYVDADPVTNAQFAAFLAATGRVVPAAFTRRAEGALAEPVRGVSWEDAAAYAAWAGKRLPSEVEWLAASQARERWGLELDLEQGPRARREAVRKAGEWCQDTWHPGFLQWANRRAPLNRWSPERGHVVRTRDGREGQGAQQPGQGTREGPQEWVGFRCVSDDVRGAP